MPEAGQGSQTRRSEMVPIQVHDQAMVCFKICRTEVVCHYWSGRVERRFTEVPSLRWLAWPRNISELWIERSER